MQYSIPWEKISRDGNGYPYRFQGGEYGGVAISFFIVQTAPGRGPSLHVHPYQEVFVLQEGQATFTIGDSTIEVSDGHVVVAPANVPHKFKNSGAEPLQMITIHPSTEIIQEWLED